MSLQIKGPWDQGQITHFLQASKFPLRLACVGRDGFPRVVSLWYGYDGQAFRCVSHRSSQLISLLQESDRVGFEIAPNDPPYHGVRGQGIASLEADIDGATLTEMLQRYLLGSDSKLGHWLLSRADDEVLITIKPTRLYSWDYRERMADAVASEDATGT